ncbi:MAG: hypothetical protein MUC68_13905 [Burkholderiaceae bacterium]|jgi:hypothetical protein|nr:hypothetical protein [Burkholderiaceae bacterium]
MSLARFLTSPIAYFLPARRVAKPAPRRQPAIGATLCCNQFRMTVQAGFSRDLWQWLVAQGWHELPAGQNRYRYRALPSNVVAALVDSAPTERDKLLALAMRRALEQEPARAERVAA